ncbi:MAG: RNA polymerase sigma factor [Turneriella sp.]|nr:RNA polymerase sigma factor [Turneriella sp.]
MSWINNTDDDIAAAVGGNPVALERILGAAQDPVYNLALRFLWHPQDAQDATQEILIRIMTNLSAFRRESQFGTWVYRIAVNHLLRAKKSRAERREISLKGTAAEMAKLDDDPLADSEADRIYDIKIACTNGILLALTRNYRIAFVLGAVLGIKSETAAEILEISAAGFRQRLARSRQMMTEFLNRQCGLMNTNAACRCAKRIRPALERGLIEPYIVLSQRMKRTGEFGEVERRLGAEISTLERTALLYRMNAEYRSPEVMRRRIREVLAGRLFSGD